MHCLGASALWVATVEIVLRLLLLLANLAERTVFKLVKPQNAMTMTQMPLRKMVRKQPAGRSLEQHRDVCLLPSPGAPSSPKTC